ncbi:hypothetical protein [Microbacterium sp. W4I20]|uniref:hypothetical protein n=1 Tax=Microbacterium sp. W4I20 TaxID=3042262 RepID=UPI002785D6B0|nr:hypothetical protein [Microbacterium sp. W4I20]MDQ0726458.1 hypothetical protein [Microbacterium sp. W4I20]
MDILELVREIDSTPDEAAPGRIERSRTKLVSAMADAPRRRARRGWVWGGSAALGTAAAAAVAVAVVITGTVAPLAPQTASAAAVAVLDGTAEIVIESTDPVLAPGQYLRVRETYELVSLWDADADPALSDAAVAGFNSSDLPTSEGAVHARGIRDLYVPGDRTQDWILDDRVPNEVVDVFGDPETLPAYERMVEAYPERDADPGGIERMPAGLQEWDPNTDSDDRYFDSFRESYDEMPRDPAQLLAWYRDHLQTSEDDSYVFSAIGRYLSTDLMPADLRAASLRVLGLLGGVDVGKTVGTVTTLELRTELDEPNGFGDQQLAEIDIDTATGRIVGIRESYPHRSTTLMPAGLPWASWTIEVTVVDEAPQP